MSVKRKKFDFKQLLPLSWYMEKNGRKYSPFIFFLDIMIYVISFIGLVIFFLLNDKDTILKAFGWLGSVLFAICAVPQSWKSIKEGHSDGSSLSFLMMWFFGELFTIIYVIPSGDAPLLTNYTLNILLVAIIIKYKLFPKDEVENS